MKALGVIAVLAILAGLAQGHAKAAPATGGGVDIVILWDPDAGGATDARALRAFLGSVRSSDRLGIVALREGAPVVLSVRPLAGAGAMSAAYEVTAALGGGRGGGGLASGVRAALDQLEVGRRPGATMAIFVVTSAKVPMGGTTDAPDGGTETLLSRLLIGEVPVFALTVGGRASPDLDAVVSSSGGKGLAIADGGDVLAGLALLYDSVQLLTANLTRTKDEPDAGRVDYRYLDEVIATPDEGIEKDAERARGAALEAAAVTRDHQPSLLLLVCLVGALVLANVAVLILFLAERRGHRSASPPGGQAAGGHRVNESPSFSRLTMGLSGFRKAFVDAERRLDALGLDLEDFGAQSWDLEKRLMDDYVTLAHKVFLVLDHLRLERAAAGDESRSSPEQRLARLLEDAGIEEIAPREGDALDGRLHVRVEGRTADASAGTVLAVSRVGYVKTEGLAHGEPLVLRKAEVVVSDGPGAPGANGGAR